MTNSHFTYGKEFNIRRKIELMESEKVGYWTLVQ